jgi:hypothetical protein
MPTTVNPARPYTIALIVLAFLLLAGVGDMVFLRHYGETPPTAKPIYVLIAYLGGLYVLAIAATVALRAWAPAAGRIATVALNIILLLAFPFGTAVGIYGLWRVDRTGQPAAS